VALYNEIVAQYNTLDMLCSGIYEKATDIIEAISNKAVSMAGEIAEQFSVMLRGYKHLKPSHFDSEYVCFLCHILIQVASFKHDTDYNTMWKHGRAWHARLITYNSWFLYESNSPLEIGPAAFR